MPNICAQCKKEFQPGESILNALGKKWHTSCFVCGACKKPFATSGSGTCVLLNGVPMHERCVNDENESESGECEICKKPLLPEEPILSLGDGTKRYHQKCFVCAKCKKPFTQQDGYHVLQKGKPYHPDCIIDKDKMKKSATKKSMEKNKICKACGKKITASVRIVPDIGHFHPHCFVCDSCRGDLDGKYFVHPETEKPACETCIAKFRR